MENESSSVCNTTMFVLYYHQEGKTVKNKLLFEFDPYYYRSGYIKSKLLVRLKNIKLSASEVKRLQKVICNAIVSQTPKCEFKYYARLLKNVGTPEFRQKLQNLSVPPVQFQKDRLKCCLQEIYWRNKQ